MSVSIVFYWFYIRFFPLSLLFDRDYSFTGIHETNSTPWRESLTTTSVGELKLYLSA
uniref:Hypothetical secreted peptide n=1 Tax=Glossina morsitans morsitans TaxID=37546 RepID=D3TSL1_GLOMM